MTMVNKIAFGCDDSTEWYKFIVPILNRAQGDFPKTMRIGQRLMLSLSDLQPEICDAITNTNCDVWEETSASISIERFELFFERIFQLFVESLD